MNQFRDTIMLSLPSDVGYRVVVRDIANCFMEAQIVSRTKESLYDANPVTTGEAFVTDFAATLLDLLAATQRSACLLKALRRAKLPRRG